MLALNATISAAVRELASAHTLTFKARVFRRAAAAVLAVDKADRSTDWP